MYVHPYEYTSMLDPTITPYTTSNCKLKDKKNNENHAEF